MPNAPIIIDLYSGVGGLSLGAVKAGFNLKAAVEYEKRIIDSHKKNFPNSTHICADITSLKGKTITKISKIGLSEISGIIGGPPCQGFSLIGKRNIIDERNNHFKNFFKIVSQLSPAFYLAENVPGILDQRYDNLRKSAINLVNNEYKVLDPISISANEFGAATSRTRIFFIGVRNDILGSEHIREKIELKKTKNPIFVKTALQGLPENISEDWIDFESSWKKIKMPLKNDYITLLNSFSPGVGDSESMRRFIKNREISCCFGTKHTKIVIKRFEKLQPGQLDKISKCQKLNPNWFCPTLRAGTDSSRGSFQSVRPIHPNQPRVITPREAARLQGFPDWFQFHETKWHSFRQIGNSVCPIAAEKVLSAVKESLNM